jgi:HSP20 family protein
VGGILFPIVVGGDFDVEPKKIKSMSLIRYNPIWRDFAPTTFSSLIDRFFNDSLVRYGGSTLSFVPSVDVLEDETGYDVQVAVPGMNKEDFKVDVDDNVLTVSGERKMKRESRNDGVYSVETQYGKFSRSFTLPEDADSAKINAKYTNGILEIRIPKDEKKAHKMTIKVS